MANDDRLLSEVTACDECAAPYELVRKMAGWVPLPTCDCIEKRTEAEADRRFGKLITGSHPTTPGAANVNRDDRSNVMTKAPDAEGPYTPRRRMVTVRTGSVNTFNTPPHSPQAMLEDGDEIVSVESGHGDGNNWWIKPTSSGMRTEWRL